MSVIDRSSNSRYNLAVENQFSPSPVLQRLDLATSNFAASDFGLTAIDTRFAALVMSTDSGA